MTRRAALAGLAAVSLACAGGGGVPGEALHDPYTEVLALGAYPPDAPWPQVTDEHTREGTLAEWSPVAREVRHPKDVLSEFVLFGRQETEPADAAQAEVIRIAKTCSSTHSDGPSAGSEDGNDVAYAAVTCAGGSLVLLKVIRGHEALYLVRREFAHAPASQERRAADAWLADQVYLCPVTGGIGRCAKR
ncbi:MAG TPA: hypothetical protein VMR86_18365 [Myxococcota bacterium]|nr:hypothetical protein [Myxococcota bacterium]